MSEKIGDVLGMGNAVAVSTFSGPKGQFAVQLTLMRPDTYLQLKPDQVLELIDKLYAALRSGRLEKWDPPETG